MSNTANVTSLEDEDHAAQPAAAVSVEAKELIRHHDELSGERRILTIHQEQGPAGNHAVFIGLNGVGYQVPRGKPFNVPAELVENLDNAVVTTYERDDKGQATERQSPRFGYSSMQAKPVGKAAEKMLAELTAAAAAAAKSAAPAAAKK